MSVAAENVALLRTGYVDQETGMRGFVLTGAETFLEPYESGRRQVDQQLAAVRRALADDPDALGLLDRVEAAGSRWRNEAAGPMIEARRSGDAARAATLVAEGLGKARFDPLRAELDRLAVEVEARLRSARVRTDRLGTAQVAVLSGILALVAIGSVLAQLLMRRWVVRPVEHVRDAALAVRDGQFDVQVPTSGPEELAELGSAVRDMRDTIVLQLDEAVRSHEALEQDALVVVELRSHLGPYLGDLGAGWSAAAELRPAEGLVAGDCYDVVRVDHRRVACVVVDIAGHGGAAGLLALRSKEQLRAALGAGLTPGEAVGNVAQQLTGLRDGMFLTAFVALVDLTDGRCWYTNAGHPPPMLVTDDDLVELAPTGPLVGPIRATWRTGETVIEPGAKLLVYTDGLTEARNAGGTMMGEARLAEALRNQACEEARVVVKQCFAELEAFAPERLHDDVTVVVLCRSVADG